MIIKIGKTEKYINDVIEKNGAALHMYIDPCDYKTEEEAINVGFESAEGGADILLIGGSTGAQGELLDNVTKGIKEKVNVPVVLFPGNIATITKYADAVEFMSLLNSRNPYWIMQAQMLSAPIVKKMKLEPLPVGYIVVEPGGTVGWVGDANMVPRVKPKIAAALANAGEFIGNRFIVTDAGANPALQSSGPIPAEMIRAVKDAITVPYIVGGGIRNTEQLATAYRAGADIVQIGTAMEEEVDKVRKNVAKFAKVTKEEGAKKV
ncbi:geranylgeranylglyceryl/heptaprenylglyceryl phosphate synthase [bacterium]|nr:MAG: geranylgeranylglyceryl/heptaprenylglyceryl phosphate synthase [bacterium]